MKQKNENRADAEQDQRVAIKSVGKTTHKCTGIVFFDRQGRDISDTAAVEISMRAVMY